MSDPSFEELRDRVPIVDADTYKHIIVVRPPVVPDDLPCDPYYCARWILHHDFGQYSPTGKAPWLVWDTTSEMAYDLLRYVAISGKGGAVGAPLYGSDDAWDRDGYKAHRMQDYQDGLGQALAIIKSLNKTTRFKHVIQLFHKQELIEKNLVQRGKQWVEDETIVGYDAKLVGRKMNRSLSIYFEHYLWLENKGYDSVQIELHLTKGDGKHEAKFRSRNPFPSSIYVPFDYEGQVEVHRELARLAGIDLTTADGPGFRDGWYAFGGSGKTMLATSVPPEVLELGPMVYVGYDPAAHNMTSTHSVMLEPKTVR